MPSVDKVGRYFPLTIASEVAALPGMMLSVLSAQTWYAALERTAVAALNVNAGAEDLDRNLANCLFPSGRPAGQRQDAWELAKWWKGQNMRPKVISLPTESSLVDLFEVTAETLLTDSSTGKSFWWTASPESGYLQLHCFWALPPPKHVARMLEANPDR
jgi:type VI secretion system protein ImpM